jgi:hypothetical protein
VHSSGVGSMPGEDVRESQGVIVGELSLPHLVELPGRGPAATMTPRTAVLLTDLHVDLQPHGWRLVAREGRDHRRALSLLRSDLDVFEEAVERHEGSVKVQVCGPWTLAATLDRPLGDKALGDRGACRDIADSLADGLAVHVAEVARRTGCEVVVQVDEPALPGIMRGTLPTASGWGRLRTPEEGEVVDLLGRVLAAAPGSGVHCCAAEVDLGALRRAGAAWVGLDLTLEHSDAALAELVEADLGLHAGIVDPTRPLARNATETLQGLRRLWSRTGLEDRRLQQVTVTPTCGLAASVLEPVQVLARCREAAQELGR